MGETSVKGADKYAEGRGGCDSAAKPGDVRAALLESLSAGLSAALASGDLEAARVATEAIGRLLGMPGAELAGRRSI